MTHSTNRSVSCILLVDDDDADNFIHKRVIKKSGLAEHVRVAHNGKEAIAYLTRSEPWQDTDKHPQANILFLDINMPLQNGYEFLAEFADLAPEVKAYTSIFMLTTMMEANQQSQEPHALNEVTGFFTKPLTHERLLEAIQQAELDQPPPF